MFHSDTDSEIMLITTEKVNRTIYSTNRMRYVDGSTRHFLSVYMSRLYSRLIVVLPDDLEC